MRQPVLAHAQCRARAVRRRARAPPSPPNSHGPQPRTIRHPARGRRRHGALGPCHQAAARAGRLHQPGAGRQFHAVHRGQPVPPGRQRRRRHRQGTGWWRRSCRPNATEEDVKQLAWKQMATCYDPEIPINIVDLGLIYECDVTANDDGTRSIDVQDDADRARLRHGRRAGAGRERQARTDSHRARGQRGAGVRSALEPRDDVAGRAAADGHDVAMPQVDPAAVPDCILVRHAHAQWPAYQGRDFDRPLTERGVQDAHATAREIHAAGLAPRRSSQARPDAPIRPPAS